MLIVLPCGTNPVREDYHFDIADRVLGLVLQSQPRRGTGRRLPMEQEWMAEGNCRFEPPATFFPSDGVGVEVAKRICATCPVKEPCLEYALDYRIDHGVWGGTSERQRRRILRKRGGLDSMTTVTPLGNPQT